MAMLVCFEKITLYLAFWEGEDEKRNYVLLIIFPLIVNLKPPSRPRFEGG